MTDIQVNYGGVVDLTIRSFEKLPPLPEGVETPEVFYDFSDGKVETTVYRNEESVSFWTTDLDGTQNSLEDTLDPKVWDDLDMEERDAVIEWGKEVHERIDNAIYAFTIETTTQDNVRAAIMKYALTEADEEEGDQHD